MHYASLFRFLLIFIALSGASSVLLGAWLAHVGQELMPVDKTRLVTAHQYQLLHTLAALASLLSYRVNSSRALLISSILFVVGILAFSGSLYLKTYTGVAVFANLAPIGGISLVLGWLALVFTGMNKK